MADLGGGGGGGEDDWWLTWGVDEGMTWRLTEVHQTPFSLSMGG